MSNRKIFLSHVDALLYGLRAAVLYLVPGHFNSYHLLFQDTIEARCANKIKSITYKIRDLYCLQKKQITDIRGSKIMTNTIKSTYLYFFNLTEKNDLIIISKLQSTGFIVFLKIHVRKRNPLRFNSFKTRKIIKYLNNQ